MQSSARFIAILVLLSLLTTLAFAGDAAKPAANPQETTTGDNAGSTTAAPPDPQATPTPAPKPQPSSSSTSMRGPDTPGGEIFLGYSYVRMSTETRVSPAVILSDHFQYIPGGSASLTGNINNWFGLTGDIGAYSLNDVSNVDGRLYTYLFGPRFSFSHKRWTPFIETLVGGARLTASTANPATVTDAPFFNRNLVLNGSNYHQNSFAADAGFGLDVHFNRHVGVRLFEVDYLFTRFSDGRDNRQNNIRASAGLLFRFGYPSAPPPPRHPPSATCSATPATIFAGSGDTVSVHADASSPDNSALTYAWSATGGTVDGTGPTVRWNPGTSAPGKYTVTAKVDDAQGLSTSCSADVEVQAKPNRPPTLSCAASTTTVAAGQRVQISANATDPDNDPLTFTWTSSGGHVVGTGASVEFDTTGVQPGHYTVNGQVSDGKGGTADCKVDLDVQIPVEQKQLEAKLSLHSIFFPTAQPTVKNPKGGLLASQQRTLETLASDFKRYLTFRPDAHLILHGHADPRGGEAYNKALSERRVERTKSFLVERGVPADHIDTEALGEEQPLSAAEIKQLADSDQTLTPDQKARIAKNAKVVALAQSRRVDVSLSTTGQTSVRQYPFNAEDVLNLVSPRSTGPAKAPAKAPAKKGTTKKKAPPATKK